MKKSSLIVLLFSLILILAACSDSENASKEEGSKEAKYAEMFKSHIKVMTDDMLELNQDSYNFIVDNYKIFPANSDVDIQNVKQMADETITAKLLNKNVQPYLNKIATFEGTVVSIEENTGDDGDVVSLIHVLDEDMQSYHVLLYKTTGDILEEDYVRFWGVPVGPSSFENISGGITNVQNFLGSHIEKIN